MNTKKHRLNLKKYPGLQLHKEVSALCYPFLKKFNYSILNFIRVYDNGNVLYLCDNYDWLNHYLKHGYPSIGAFEQNTSLRNQEYILWDALNEDDPIVIYSRKLFNIKYGVTLIRKFKNGYDFFNFGTDKNSLSMLNVIIAQMDELDKFSKTFYDKSKHLLYSMEKNLVSLNEFNCKLETPKLTKEIYLGPNYGYSHLTTKEISYLKSLTEGMTIPEVATLCEVSPRTIEKHMENIKQKLGCKTQCELGYIIAKLGILEPEHDG